MPRTQRRCSVFYLNEKKVDCISVTQKSVASDACGASFLGLIVFCSSDADDPNGP